MLAHWNGMQIGSNELLMSGLHTSLVYKALINWKYLGVTTTVVVFFAGTDYNSIYETYNIT
jgi:hypothetical protein